MNEKLPHSDRDALRQRWHCLLPSLHGYRTCQNVYAMAMHRRQQAAARVMRHCTMKVWWIRLLQAKWSIAGCLGDNECGFQFDVRIPPVFAATFSYWFKFSKGFDWTSGGKMPGAFSTLPLHMLLAENDAWTEC
jgi:hypothetical protein